MIGVNIANYADDSTIYALENDIEMVAQKLQNESKPLSVVFTKCYESKINHIYF